MKSIDDRRLCELSPIVTSDVVATIHCVKHLLRASLNLEKKTLLADCHQIGLPVGFQRAIRSGDRCSCQLPSRWRKAKWPSLSNYVSLRR